MQYLCFQQFKTVKKQAEEKKVFLKGDIPILINRESADVWLHRKLFFTQYSAGAPPDMYSSTGQNWGFPIYDWKEHVRDNFNWWRQRLQVASQLYDLYRIDHVVGFFRIWAIAQGMTGKDGKFIPKNPAEWIPHGEPIMRMMLETPDMLPIAEDLGVVPPEVRVCLRQLGICGTKVMRWERKWNGDKSFILPENYISESMTTVSTHDSDTLTLWWRNSPEEAKAYADSKKWIYVPEITRKQLQEILKESHHSGSLFHINLLNEYFPLVDNLTWPNPEDERINTPGIISDRNWTYRFKPSVEQIVSNTHLFHAIKQLIQG